MLIKDVLTSHDGAPSVFERHDLGCPMCLAAELETLSSVATMHDISVDALIDDLNALPARDGEEDA
jgi:hybrid cluster-associated redox disulfide protein